MSADVVLAAALPALWALGWTTTTAVGVDVDAQYPTFGAAGALTVSALSAPLLTAIMDGRIRSGHPPAR